MSLTTEIQTRIIGLANGSIPPQTGMEIHFVNVCRGKAMPCSTEEHEWFNFLNHYRSLAEESENTGKFSYEYDLPGMAELDEIFDFGINLKSFHDLTQTLLELSEAHKKLIYLEERVRLVEVELERKANLAAEHDADRIFQKRIQQEATMVKDAIDDHIAQIESIQSTLQDLTEKQNTTNSELETLKELDHELYEKLKTSYCKNEQGEIKKDRAWIREQYDSIVPQDMDYLQRIKELRTQDKNHNARVIELEQKITELDNEKPSENDRVVAHEGFIQKNGTKLEVLKQELKATQDRLSRKKSHAIVTFEKHKPELIIEKTRKSMSPGRRQTYLGLRTMPSWGEYRSDWIQFQNLMTEYKIERLYHFTDMRNLNSISELGGLFSWLELEKKGIDIPAAGGSDLSRDLDGINHLKDYVHLSFRRDPPMLSSIQSEGRIGRAFIFEISPDVIFFSRTRFSDVNAASIRMGTNIGNSLSIFQTIRFDVLWARWDEETKPYVQAEVLIPNHVPKDFILNWSTMEQSLLQ